MYGLKEKKEEFFKKNFKLPFFFFDFSSCLKFSTLIFLFLILLVCKYKK